MPSFTKQVKPKVLITHQGITVYHTYPNDNVDNTPCSYFYTTDPISSENQFNFDIRKLGLPNYNEDQLRPPFTNSYEFINADDEGKIKIQNAWDDWHTDGFIEFIKKQIKEAIELGLIKVPRGVEADDGSLNIAATINLRIKYGMDKEDAAKALIESALQRLIDNNELVFPGSEILDYEIEVESM